MTDDLHSGVVRVDEEHRRSTAVTRFARCAGHADRICGTVRAGDEPLTAVDPPAARLLCSARGQSGRIRPRSGRGLGHREAGPHLARCQRPQIPLLLLGRRDGLQHVHVALVGGGDVQCQRAEQRVARRLEDGCASAHVQAVPAELRRHVRGEEPRVLRRLLQPRPHRVTAARGHACERLLLGDDDAAHELGSVSGEFTDHRVMAKINGHVNLLHTGRRRPKETRRGSGRESSVFRQQSRPVDSCTRNRRH